MGRSVASFRVVGWGTCLPLASTLTWTSCLYRPQVLTPLRAPLPVMKLVAQALSARVDYSRKDLAAHSPSWMYTVALAGR